LGQVVGAGWITGGRVRLLGRDDGPRGRARQGERDCPGGESPKHSGAKP